MPRGRKKADAEIVEGAATAESKETKNKTITYSVSADANETASTNRGKMKVYTSKPKKSEATSVAKPDQLPSNFNPDEMEHVVYELSDADHPINRISSFSHCTIYWIPNSEQFIVENIHRAEGKSIISVPTGFFTDEEADVNAINAVLGMHFGEESKGQLDMIRQGISQDAEHIRVFQLVELGLVRDEDKIQYTYLTF